MSTKMFAALSLMALVALPVFAERPMNVTIPFDFAVGNTHMTAGEYQVTFDIPGTIRVSSADRKATCTVITNAAHAKKTLEVGSLVFNRYGKSYFLSHVWSSGYDQGRAMLPSKAEKELARNAAEPAQVASLPARNR